MSNLLEEKLMELTGEIPEVIATVIIDAKDGITLVTSVIDQSFDPQIASGYFTRAWQSAVKAFEASNWGIPYEQIIPGTVITNINIALRDGNYLLSITVNASAGLGIVRAVIRQYKDEIESLLP